MKLLGKLTYFVGIFITLVSCLDTAIGQTNAFVITPGTVNVTAPVGTSAFPSNVTVNTSGASVNFSIATSGALPTCDIRYQTATTVTPSQVTVFVETAGLSVGTYACGVVFSASGLTAVTVPVNITITGSASAGLSVSPQSLTLSGQTGAFPVTQNLTLTNSNLSVAVSYTAQVTYPSAPPAAWLSVSPTSGAVPPNGTVQVQANPNGLPSGTYSGTILITPSGAAAINIPVTFSVSGSPTLQIQQAGSTVSAVNFAYQSGTSLPAPQTLSVSSSSTSTPLQFNVAVNGGSTFLVVTPTGLLSTPSGGGSTNLTLSIASTATGLPAGTYTANVVISSAGASNPTTTIPVNFTVSALPLLSINAPPAAFNYSVGGTTPASQSVILSTSSTSLGISVFSNLPAGQTWLSALPSAPAASAAAPATITISVNPAGLAAGTYTGTVRIVANGAGNTPFDIPVTLNVSSSTLLNVTPSQLAYTYQTGGPQPVGQTINVASSSGSLNYTVTATTTGCGTSWITLSQPGGTTGAGGSSVSVFVNPAGIPGPSICQGTLNITATGATNTVSVPIVLQVSSAPIVQLSQSGIVLTGQQNNGNTLTTILTLTSSDSVSALSYTLSSPAPWLIVTPTSGNTPVNIQVAANTNSAGLQLGTNVTTITLTSPSLPAPISIPVTLTLTGNATVAVTPTTLSFTQSAGGQAPASQTVNVSLASGSGINAYTVVASANFGSWLTVNQTSQSIPGSFTVTANGASLSQGTYQGTITVSAAGANNSPLTIPVTLTVTQAQSLVLSASTLNFSATIGQQTNVPSQTLQVTSPTGPVTFTVGTTATTCPGFLTATPTSATTPATITVAVNFASLPVGTCTGSVTVSAPGAATQTSTVTLTVAGLPPPSVTQVVNGASFVPSAIAPGEIVTIFGTNLGPTTLAPYILNANNTFATKVAETEILFDGVAAPILFVRNDQVAVIVPFEIAGRFQTTIQIRRSGVVSGSIIQRVVDTAPGIFTVPSGGTGQGAIVNSNGVVNNASAPAARGGTVSVYFTGAGQTNPAGVSGALNSASPLNIINADVTVTIGGVNAPVSYKGGAPGNVQGLYQLNVTIPATIGAGQQPIVVTVGGVPTQSGVVVSVQ